MDVLKRAVEPHRTPVAHLDPPHRPHPARLALGGNEFEFFVPPTTVSGCFGEDGQDALTRRALFVVVDADVEGRDEVEREAVDLLGDVAPVEILGREDELPAPDAGGVVGLGEQALDPAHVGHVVVGADDPEIVPVGVAQGGPSAPHHRLRAVGPPVPHELVVGGGRVGEVGRDAAVGLRAVVGVHERECRLRDVGHLRRIVPEVPPEPLAEPTPVGVLEVPVPQPVERGRLDDREDRRVVAQALVEFVLQVVIGGAIHLRGFPSERRPQQLGYEPPSHVLTPGTRSRATTTGSPR